MLSNSSQTLKSGDAAPDFSLSTADGKKVGLSDYQGRLLAVVFIRGTW